ncbi:hypothetical protein HanIR_Chr11g0524651 [Helianthus annuus]|nr:hypothetical protein HanIR_Chr11g0524651 [Helianthus annuus]
MRTIRLTLAHELPEQLCPPGSLERQGRCLQLWSFAIGNHQREEQHQIWTPRSQEHTNTNGSLKTCLLFWDKTCNRFKVFSVLWQGLAAAMDEDVAKFTDAVKEFDSMTKLYK